MERSSALVKDGSRERPYACSAACVGPELAPTPPLLLGGLYLTTGLGLPFASGMRTACQDDVVRGALREVPPLWAALETVLPPIFALTALALVLVAAGWWRTRRGRGAALVVLLLGAASGGLLALLSLGLQDPPQDLRRAP